MQASIDAGTDVAMLAVWDASLQKDPFAPADMDRFDDLLHDDADLAKLLLIHTGADGGGPVHLFIDEPPPAHLLPRCRILEPDRLVHLPTSALALDGAEHYRDPSSNPPPIDTLSLAPGDYRIRVLVPKDAESFPVLTAPPHGPPPQPLSEDDLAFFRRIERTHLLLSALALPLLALLPLLHFVAGLTWLISLIITLIPLMIYAVPVGARFHRDKSNPRYQEIRRTLARQQALNRPLTDPPTLILALTRLNAPDPDLQGGTVRVQ